MQGEYPGQRFWYETDVFQGCFKEVWSVFRESFNGVSRKFLGFCTEVSRVFHGSFKGVLRKFQRYFKEVSRVFHKSFKEVEVSRMFHDFQGCSKSVS